MIKGTHHDTTRTSSNSFLGPVAHHSVTVPVPWPNTLAPPCHETRPVNTATHTIAEHSIAIAMTMATTYTHYARSASRRLETDLAHVRDRQLVLFLHCEQWLVPFDRGIRRLQSAKHIVETAPSHKTKCAFT